MNSYRRFGVIAIALVGTTIFCVPQARAAFVTDRYDFEESTSTRTAAGYTHMDPTIAFGPSTVGFDTTLSTYAFTRSTNPNDLLADKVVGYSKASILITNPTIFFREIMPEAVTNVKITIYASDPEDGYVPNYLAGLAINDNTPVTDERFTVNSTTFVYDKSFLTPTTGTLDFRFYEAANPGNSGIRINGIELEYSVPEPMIAGPLGIGALFLRLRRRRVA